MPAKSEATAKHGYIPEDGVWTAEERRLYAKAIGSGRDIYQNQSEANRNVNTVAALIAACRDLRNLVATAYPQASPDDPIATSAWKKVGQADELLEALR